MIRHSALPKLAECPCYEGAPGTSEAAARGTKLDAIFRALVERDELPEGLDAEDAAAVRWAAYTLRELSEGNALLTAEEDCKVRTPGMEHVGTADAICLGLGFHADLKTGQIRNYAEQMAAYAMGLMEEHFVSEWTAYVLFADQRKVVRHHFTYTEASQMVAAVLEAAQNPKRAPKACDYCTWCAKQTSCPVRTEAVEQALAVNPTGFEAVLADPERVGQFLTQCKVLDDFRDLAEAKVRELLESGAEVPGWKLRRAKESQIVFPDEIGRHLKTLGFGRVLDAFGPMSGTKFKKLWEEALPNEPIPDGIFKTKAANKPSLIQA